MRKIIWLLDISLDGFMSGPNGGLDWAGAHMNDELWDDLNALLARSDAALFGRVTYQLFEQYWPAVPRNPASPKNERDFWQWIDPTPKIVASKTLRRLEWKNSILLGTDTAADIKRMKAQSGKALLMFGSCNFAACLLNAGLIDELQIRIHPVILGVGRPLFNQEVGRHKLRLVDSRVTRVGLVRLQYDVA
jgi:dihydrofolate reductase